MHTIHYYNYIITKSTYITQYTRTIYDIWHRSTVLHCAVLNTNIHLIYRCHIIAYIYLHTVYSLEQQPAVLPLAQSDLPAAAQKPALAVLLVAQVPALVHLAQAVHRTAAATATAAPPSCLTLLLLRRPCLCLAVAVAVSGSSGSGVGAETLAEVVPPLPYTTQDISE